VPFLAKKASTLFPHITHILDGHFKIKLLATKAKSEKRQALIRFSLRQSESIKMFDLLFELIKQKIASFEK
jgi:hypothetical protein